MTTGYPTGFLSVTFQLCPNSTSAKKVGLLAGLFKKLRVNYKEIFGMGDLGRFW